MTRCAALWWGTAALLGCAADPETRATLEVKETIDAELVVLLDAARSLRAHAPAPDADGWNARDDGPAVEAMKEEWRRARRAYERIEGAIAVLFPHLDASTDERYDGFIAEVPDDNLFDGMGVTGVHGIERILWADSHPPQVVEFESGLLHYTPAAFPATEREARDFESGLAARLVSDVEEMQRSFTPLALDPAAAYTGVVGSVFEQFEKVNLAFTGEDESRYAQFTLADMRANLEGGRRIYASFSAWIASRPGGRELDAQILARFDELQTAYDALPGDAIPPVPSTWNPSAPSAEDLATPYGELWQLLSLDSDPGQAESLVSRMVEAGAIIGIEVVP